jgi:hypothetical protein
MLLWVSGQIPKIQKHELIIEEPAVDCEVGVVGCEGFKLAFHKLDQAVPNGGERRRLREAEEGASGAV